MVEPRHPCSHAPVQHMHTPAHPPACPPASPPARPRARPPPARTRFSAGSSSCTRYWCPTWLVPSCISKPSFVSRREGWAMTPAFAMSRSRESSSAARPSPQRRTLARSARSSCRTRMLPWRRWRWEAKQRGVVLVSVCNHRAWGSRLQQLARPFKSERVRGSVGAPMVHAISTLIDFVDLWTHALPDIGWPRPGGLTAADVWWRKAVRLDSAGAP